MKSTTKFFFHKDTFVNTKHYCHRRHCNLGHRAKGRVVFLPRPDIYNEMILLNRIFMSAPKWDGLILARNGALEDK